MAGQAVHLRGGDSVVDGRVLRTRLRATRGEWAALVVTLNPLRDADPAALMTRLDGEVREDDHLLEHALLPSHSPERARDALRVLRMCTYASTGAVVASPTTSLPAAPGHERQSDYRYTWLRDASLAVSVAALLGRRDVLR